MERFKLFLFVFLIFKNNLKWQEKKPYTNVFLEVLEVESKEIP